MTQINETELDMMKKWPDIYLIPSPDCDRLLRLISDLRATRARLAAGAPSSPAPPQAASTVASTRIARRMPVSARVRAAPNAECGPRSREKFR